MARGVMNYLSFTRPAWCWLRRDARGCQFLGDPLPVPRFGGRATAESFQELLAVQPWRSTVAGFNLLGSHDTSRFRSVCGSAGRQIAGAGLLHTFPGVPMVFAGDEVGLTGVEGDGARRPMPWDAGRWETGVLDAYRGLGALRRSSRALRHGGLRWVHTATTSSCSSTRRATSACSCKSGGGAHPEVAIDAASLDGEVGERRLAPAT